jgi:2-octaprenyl-6-methoxyphenol hydroxylase
MPESTRQRLPLLMQVIATEAAVIGAGPAGLATALALAKSGIATAIVAPSYNATHAGKDARTTALMGPSVDLLRNLGVWELCEDRSAAIAAVRLADGLGNIVRAPEALFTAAELGLPGFGANIANSDLVAALDAAAQGCPNLHRIVTTGVTCVTPGADNVRVSLAEGGCVDARLAVAADGRGSIARHAAGIALHQWSYPQAAVAASFTHTRAHHGTVNELHRRTGPLTTVPLPGLSSSLVWVEEPNEAQRLMALGESAFAQALQEHFSGLLGDVCEVTPRALYPLAGAGAASMAARRIALVGEAAHVVPPIGAQGLNLGMHDAAALAECAEEATHLGQQLGGPEMLAAYQRARSGDVAFRSAAIDLLNRSLLHDLLPLAVLRSAAVHAVTSSATLRRLLMQAGMGTAAPLPRLMRPNAVGP